MPGSSSSDPVALPPTEREDSPISLAVHRVELPSADSPPARLGRIKMLLVLLVCASPVLASYFTYYVIRPEGRVNVGRLLDPQRPMPGGLALQQLDGSPVLPAQLRQQWLLVAVAGGACEALCERQLYLQRQLREALGREKERVERVWLIDDASVVRPALLPALESATVLRAERAALDAWLPAEPGGGRALFYLVDPLGNLMMSFPPDASPSQVKRDLERLLRASSSWDRAGR